MQMGMVLATSPSAARRAAQAVQVTYHPPAAPPVLSVEQAIEQGSMHPLAQLIPFLAPGVLPDSVMVAAGGGS